MDKTIQGHSQAWDRLSGGSQHNPGNKMEYPSHTNSRGYANHREMHAEGEDVGRDEDRDEHRRGGHMRRCRKDGESTSDKEDSSDDDSGDSEESDRRGGRVRRHHADGGQTMYQTPMSPPQMAQPTTGQPLYRTPPAPAPLASQPAGMPTQQQPRPFRRGGMIG